LAGWIGCWIAEDVFTLRMQAKTGHRKKKNYLAASVVNRLKHFVFGLVSDSPVQTFAFAFSI